MVKEWAKDGEIPMRAMTMMKRNIDDDRGIPMMQRSTDNYDEEDVKETGRGGIVDQPMNQCQ